MENSAKLELPSWTSVEEQEERFAQPWLDRNGKVRCRVCNTSARDHDESHDIEPITNVEMRRKQLEELNSELFSKGTRHGKA